MAACTGCSGRRCRRSCSATRAGRKRSLLFAAMGLLVALAASLAVFRLVVLKMLPFDNKSEVQVVVDMPEGSTLERTNALLSELAAEVDGIPEVLDYEGLRRHRRADQLQRPGAAVLPAQRRAMSATCR